jgi:hypothetical protein
MEGPRTLDGMTDAEARIAIAKDVIKHLDSKKLNAKSGAYCIFKSEAGQPPLSESDGGSDLRGLLSTKVHHCDVCAKGAMFIAHVMRFNEVKLPSADWAYFDPARAFNGESFVTSPLQYFDEDQLDLIEAAFEGDDVQGSLSEEETDDAESFSLSHENDDERLRAIMQNIVDNGGTFLL